MMWSCSIVSLGKIMEGFIIALFSILLQHGYNPVCTLKKLDVLSETRSILLDDLV